MTNAATKTAGRYAIRAELEDGTLEDHAGSLIARKDVALHAAKALAKQARERGFSTGTVAYWVDDARKDLGVKRFAV